MTWIDAANQHRQASEKSVRRLRAALGHPPGDLEELAPVVTRPGGELRLGAVAVDLEGGGRVHVNGALPQDFPLGYHTVVEPTGKQRLLVVSPGRCHVPSRRWGWSVQLYAARSHHSWGIGDLADLRHIRTWAEQYGAGFVLSSPLHAAAPTLPQQTSPYLPVTRRYRDPIYLRIEDVPGADHVDLTDLRSAASALNRSPLIDRDAVWGLKSAALERIFGVAESDGDFTGWRRSRGSDIEQFALWCSLAERFGGDWRHWPPPLQVPSSREVSGLAVELEERVTFYTWLQWLVDDQLRRACGSMPLIQDLPIGVDGGGADSWMWPTGFVGDARVGAPPDFFNPSGQEWGAPPMNPWRLRTADYLPFLEPLRATLEHGGARIDHVLGLFRQWWVPVGAAPADGAYVRYPSSDLLDLIALESTGAEALVVGEDLGTVAPEVRGALAQHAILSYRLLWFEDDPPSQWPALSLASVTTHDLPTVAGLWTGSDLAEQRGYGSGSDEQLDHGRRQLLGRLTQAGGPNADASVDEAVLGAYQLLGQAPSALLCASLDDAVGAERRPNLPGILDRPNWRIPLAVPLDELFENRLATEVAGVLNSAVGR